MLQWRGAAVAQRPRVHAYALSSPRRPACPTGVLSKELQEALGMMDGAPPPWLINMQRYGPPPSYPSLKIPGLNAPIPPGAQFGYHPGARWVSTLAVVGLVSLLPRLLADVARPLAGAWGKPPVDEHGNPIYGDVFGLGDEEADEEELVRVHACT